jgi:hypothetical protein
VLPQAIKSLRAIVGCALAFAVSASALQILQLRVVEGEGVNYRIGTRATRGVTVMVSDEAGHPVDMASVSFRLPDEGASGTFDSGSRTEIATTGPDGRASVWGMHWNKTPGTLEIRISAVKDQVRAGLVSTQYLSDTAAPKAGGEGVFTSSSHGGHKWLWIAAIATGAAAGGAFAMLHSSSNPANTSNPAVVGISIGTPSVIVAHP